MTKVEEYRKLLNKALDAVDPNEYDRVLDELDVVWGQLTKEEKREIDREPYDEAAK